jgi:hypothetical protein
MNFIESLVRRLKAITNWQGNYTKYQLEVLYTQRALLRAKIYKQWESYPKYTYIWSNVIWNTLCVSGIHWG